MPLQVPPLPPTRIARAALSPFPTSEEPPPQKLISIGHDRCRVAGPHACQPSPQKTHRGVQ